MKALNCASCGEALHFENTRCLNCGRAQVFAPKTLEMALAEAAEPCANRAAIGCNWAAEEGGLCLSCALTETIPDASVPGNDRRWARVEAAKRRLLYTLLSLGLPLADDRARLSFRLLADVVGPGGGVRRVMTGHASGRITVNIAEADDPLREERRVALGEDYRTLIGHFRHEVGHFYWDMLVDRGGRRAAFADLFGDPGADYRAALQAHYRDGPPPGWETHHVSAYATAHPWEDFAETWAHYLHMTDGIETAVSYGICQPLGADPREPADFDAMARRWVHLTVVMNAMNRSVGQPDFFPFVLSPEIERKLGFVHDLIRGRRPS